MRILIDLQCCQSDSRYGGIGRYSMALAKAMLRLPCGHQFSLLLNASLPNENLLRSEFADLLSQQDIHTFSLPPYIAADNELPAHTRMAELIREKRIAEIAPDVLHIASLFEGAGENVVTSVGLLFPAQRTAVTLYDLIPYLEQETYLGKPILADHYLRKFEQLQTAGALISISEFSRQEALEHTAIPAGCIVNISSAVDSQFAPLEIGEAARSTLLRKCGIDKPFLMFTGSFDARKNHVRLVKAFARVLPTLAEPCQLVIVGKGLPRQLARLRAIARHHGLAGGDLVFVGHVTDVELVALYNLCTLFVFPSLREGFGLPVLEAMACGAATIGSNRTSVPEVIARADALFDPQSVDDLAAKMHAVLTDAGLREDLRRHGLRQARNFSWEQSARRAIASFEHLHATAGPAHAVPAVPDEANEDSVTYSDFRAALTRVDLAKASESFLMSCARTVAANELLVRVAAPGFKLRMKAGWVTSWAAGGELASYCEGIIDQLPTRPALFVCRSDQADDLLELNEALAESNIDVVMIQAGDGLFPLESLARLLTWQQKLERHVFVTFHSTGNFARLGAADAPEVRAALKACDGIFVHSIEDVRNLEIFKVRKNVSFVPKPQSCGAAAYLFGKMAISLATGGSR